MVAENKILPVTNKIINTGDRSEGFGSGYQFQCFESQKRQGARRRMTAGKVSEMV